MKRLQILLSLLVLLNSCSPTDNQINYSRANRNTYLNFRNSTIISDSNGAPTGIRSSWFPYDSVKQERFFVSIEHNTIRTMISHDDKMSLQYFTTKALDNDLIDTTLPVFYGKYPDKNNFFKALHGDILWNFYLRKDVYRLTVLRTFHNPFSISIERMPSGKNLLRLKMTDGYGGYYPGQLSVNREYELTPDVWNDFTVLIDSCHFDTLSDDLSCAGNFDGSVWYLESHSKKGYKLIWSPNPGKNSIYKKTFHFLAKYCDYEFEDVY